MKDWSLLLELTVEWDSTLNKMKLEFKSISKEQIQRKTFHKFDVISDQRILNCTLKEQVINSLL